MSKQHCNVAKLVVFVSVDSIVILGKRLLKKIAPQTVDFGKSLANQSKKLGVCLFLRTTLDNHRGQFWLLTIRQINLHQLVNSFFGVGARHNGEVNSPSQVDQVGVGLIFDLHGL